MQKMINFGDDTNENIKKYNSNWSQMSGYPYRILII